MAIDPSNAGEKPSSTVSAANPPPVLWPQGSYPPRPGNEVEILIDGQAAYAQISSAFHKAAKFIYLTISFGDEDFLLVPENNETMFDILRSREKAGVDVRMVVWQPALHTPDTIPDPSPAQIIGVNGRAGSIQARWDKAKGYKGLYSSPHGLFKEVPVDFPDILGCHHQKTYVMDDGEGKAVAFVGGINPVQAYWDTPVHDSLDPRRVAQGEDLLKGLEKTPPLHDIFYRIRGPAVADVMANFVERFNGASIPHREATSDVKAPFTADDLPRMADGMEVQVLRTIAPHTYRTTEAGEKSIRDLYLNALGAAGAGCLVYIENQYFFDNGVIAEIHAAAERGAKIIAVLTSSPDEGTFAGYAETILEKIAGYQTASQQVAGHANVALLTLGNSRPDPRAPGKVIYSETYIHSKNMAVIGPAMTVMSGGSGNIAFTSMWFHSEMNIAFIDAASIRKWVALLWSEHLGIPEEKSGGLINDPEGAFNFFKEQAARNEAALTKGEMPEGRVYRWGITFPPRVLEGINLGGAANPNSNSKS